MAPTGTESKSYARVVAWGMNSDGTIYQSACTVYEDPATGSRREETTSISGPAPEQAVLMVRVSKM